MSIEKSAAEKGRVEPGVLYPVATPIGNLADISQRAIDTLRAVDIIAAEDTRHSQRLLAHLGIGTPLLACHEHNEEKVAGRLVERMRQGESVALISDAGTPLLSDPGYRLVRLAHAHGVRVSPVPGACAAIAALSAAGLPTDRFCFEGFAPAKTAARQKAFAALKDEPRSLVFYVSCHRIVETLADMIDAFGAQRPACLARELSKTFETIRQGALAELLAFVEADENQRKGEIVLVLGGQTQSQSMPGQDAALAILLQELPLKQAVNLAVKLYGGNRNELYKKALAMKDGAT